MRRLAIFGAGGHGRVVVATARAAGWTVAEIWDDDPEALGRELAGVRVTRPPEPGSTPPTPALLALGDNRSRRRIAERYDGAGATLVHPRATVDESVALGEGTVVFAGAVIQTGARIGRHVIVNTGALVDHDSVLGDFAHVAPGAALAGETRVGEGALLGVGCRLLPRARVGRWATVGAGAVVVRSIADGVTAVGVPARERSGP
ncbi:MAG: acetyltransferase [Thermoanaerobaculia bacterium]|nr:acetyltransferase [Thermoanaerobaculia bacterium]